MASLCSMIAPDITVLTNIGDAHSEGFSSRQEKIAEKLKLAKESKALIYPAAAQMLANFVPGHSVRLSAPRRHTHRQFSHSL